MKYGPFFSTAVLVLPLLACLKHTVEYGKQEASLRLQPRKYGLGMAARLNSNDFVMCACVRALPLLAFDKQSRQIKPAPLEQTTQEFFERARREPANLLRGGKQTPS